MRGSNLLPLVEKDEPVTNGPDLKIKHGHIDPFPSLVDLLTG